MRKSKYEKYKIIFYFMLSLSHVCAYRKDGDSQISVKVKILWAIKRHKINT